MGSAASSLVCSYLREAVSTEGTVIPSWANSHAPGCCLPTLQTGEKRPGTKLHQVQKKQSRKLEISLLYCLNLQEENIQGLISKMQVQVRE